MKPAVDPAQLVLLLFDVDGVMTDNGLYVDDNGCAAKRFDIRDGMGLRLLRMAGLKAGIISGHDSPAVRQRAQKLGIDICMVGVEDKVAAFHDICAQEILQPNQVLFMGDDLIDLRLLRRVGFAATVPEAPAIVREHCHWVATRAGGRGAVRELIEHILLLRGQLDALLAHFVDDIVDEGV